MYRWLPLIMFVGCGGVGVAVNHQPPVGEPDPHIAWSVKVASYRKRSDLVQNHLLAVGDDGTIYATLDGVVNAYSARGKKLGSWQGGADARVLAGPQNTAYLVTRTRLDQTQMRTTLGFTQLLPGGKTGWNFAFEAADAQADLAIGDDGGLILCERDRIVWIRPDTKLRNVAYAHHGGNFVPDTCARARDGALLVAEYTDRAPGVGSYLLRFNPNGTFQREDRIDVGDIRGVAVADDGNAYVLGETLSARDNVPARSFVVRRSLDGNGNSPLWNNVRLGDWRPGKLFIDTSGNVVVYDGTLAKAFARLRGKGALQAVWEHSRTGAVSETATAGPTGLLYFASAEVEAIEGRGSTLWHTTGANGRTSYDVMFGAGELVTLRERYTDGGNTLEVHLEGRRATGDRPSVQWMPTYNPTLAGHNGPPRTYVEVPTLWHGTTIEETRCTIGDDQACAVYAERLAKDTAHVGGAAMLLVRSCKRGASAACSTLSSVGNALTGSAKESFLVSACISGDTGSCSGACIAGSPAGCHLGCTHAVPEDCDAAGMQAVSGTNMHANPALAAAYFSTACSRGSATGCGHLADLAATGTGTARNAPVALTLYRHACAKGDQRACTQANALDAQLNPCDAECQRKGNELVSVLCGGTLYQAPRRSADHACDNYQSAPPELQTYVQESLRTYSAFDAATEQEVQRNPPTRACSENSCCTQWHAVVGTAAQAGWRGITPAC